MLVALVDQAAQHLPGDAHAESRPVAIRVRCVEHLAVQDLDRVDLAERAALVAHHQRLVDLGVDAIEQPAVHARAERVVDVALLVVVEGAIDVAMQLLEDCRGLGLVGQGLIRALDMEREGARRDQPGDGHPDQSERATADAHPASRPALSLGRRARLYALLRCPYRLGSARGPTRSGPRPSKDDGLSS